jgi:hypothetical protein
VALGGAVKVDERRGRLTGSEAGFRALAAGTELAEQPVMQDTGFFLVALTRWRGTRTRRRPQAALTESPWFGEVGGVRRRFVLARGAAMTLVNPAD